jgi:hemoglobin/transferrin/lactoferrin receptor protein
MKKIFTFYISLAIAVSVHAQYAEEKQDSVVSYLDEVVISANKIPEPRRAVAQQIKIVTPSFLKNLNAQTSADLLQNTGVVAMQRSQQGGGSPMLRGFEASKVLLMIDGVRMNNLIYRAGHLQNVITMDNNILERAEITFGPSSTVYGSDALGGVVHFYTRNPELSKEKNFQVKGNFFTRLGSANNENTGHIDINLAGKKFGSLTSFTFSDFGDLKMGEKENPSLGEPFGLRPLYAQRIADNSGDELIANPDPYVQKFSGYNQYDVLQKFLIVPNERWQHLINIQFSTSSDIPRYDRLTDPQGSGLRCTTLPSGGLPAVSVRFPHRTSRNNHNPWQRSGRWFHRFS